MQLSCEHKTNRVTSVHSDLEDLRAASNQQTADENLKMANAILPQRRQLNQEQSKAQTDMRGTIRKTFTTCSTRWNFRGNIYMHTYSADDESDIDIEN